MFRCRFFLMVSFLSFSGRKIESVSSIILRSFVVVLQCWCPLRSYRRLAFASSSQHRAHLSFIKHSGKLLHRLKLYPDAPLALIPPPDSVADQAAVSLLRKKSTLRIVGSARRNAQDLPEQNQIHPRFSQSHQSCRNSAKFFNSLSEPPNPYLIFTKVSR